MWQEEDEYGWAMSLEWTTIQTHVLQSLGCQKASESEDEHVRHGGGQSKESLRSGSLEPELKQLQLQRIEQPGEREGADLHVFSTKERKEQ